MPARKDPSHIALNAEKRIATICESARQRILQEVYDHHQRNPLSPWSGQPLLRLERTLKALYASWGVDIQDEFRENLPKIMQEFYDKAAHEMATAGRHKAILGAPDPKRVEYFLNNTFDQVAARTQRMSKIHIDKLKEVSHRVFSETSLTGETRAEISRRLMEGVRDIPGFQFRGSDGRVWPDKTYFKMLARTELMAAGNAAFDDKCIEDGFDVMKLSDSGDPCDDCARFEGCLFSLTGNTPGLPTKADLKAAKVFHPNCTHTYSAVPDYIRMRDYTADGTPKDKLHRQQDVPLGNDAGERFKGRNLSGRNAQQHQIATDAVNSVHSTDSLPPVQIDYLDRSKRNPQAYGTSFTDWENGTPPRIEVYNTSPHKAFTELHEIGHYIDNFMPANGTPFTESKEFAPLWQALQKSQGYFKLCEEEDRWKHYGKSDFRDSMLARIRYALQEDEVFARAYSQYITEKSGNKALLEQLEASDILGRWQTDDFAPIKAEFDNIFKKKGWLHVKGK